MERASVSDMLLSIVPGSHRISGLKVNSFMQ